MMTHVKAIFLSGLTWLLIGAMLLFKGLRYAITSVLEMPALLSWLSNHLGTVQNGILFIIAAGLVLGYCKGRFILIKTVRRVVRNIVLQPTPLHLRNLYTSKYLVLILSMILLGLTLRFLPIGADIRGLIDITIGSALVNGALIYFRLAIALKRERSRK